MNDGSNGTTMVETGSDATYKQQSNIDVYCSGPKWRLSAT